ncbi:hypothetical protein DVH26_26080 [Paenibacillus sp. H1-7]|uniref:hypothetical protein n=1 Tax=Paenibacillus sp. H1-7 TaxID=2282849 RepID=UPI001EF88529|nr:hypothetical protein [Paenibacillus sp. H1-7]ULL17617.1 hypothetical protein DVH26_26080 [Paenibacillus sp. H1-7]
MEQKYGLLMELPDGKLPGFYAQIVKALAAKAPLFDRDKELLIFSETEERDAAYPIMEQYKIPFEDLDLILLPPPVYVLPTLTDFGLISRSEHVYVYSDAACIFTIREDGPGAEPAQAALQMDEHLLARFGREDETFYVAQAQSDELMLRIAAAYRCTVQYIHK